DQERRLEALLAVLLKPDASVEEFGRALVMPIVPGADRESQERFLEGSSTLLLWSLDDVVALRQHPSTKHDKSERRVEVRNVGSEAQKKLLPMQLGVGGQTIKHPEVLVLIADDVPDSDGYITHLTGRTIQEKVPVIV